MKKTDPSHDELQGRADEFQYKVTRLKAEFTLYHYIKGKFNLSCEGGGKWEAMTGIPERVTERAQQVNCPYCKNQMLKKPRKVQK